MEIGCGNGRLLQLMKKAGWQVNGLELSPYLSESIEKSLDIAVDVADFLEYDRDGDFDLLLLRHVLEHLEDLILAIGGINRLLRKGGKAVLEFPNIDALDLRLERFFATAGINKKTFRDDARSYQ